MSYRLIAIGLGWLLSAHTGFAAGLEPDRVLVQRGEAAITVRDFEAALQRIPEAYRAAVANHPERIADLIAQLVENELLAAEARERGLAEDPLIQAQIRLKTDQVLATELLDRVVAEQAGGADYEQMAREYYLTHKSEFTTQPRVSVTHVLIGTESRTQDEARALAQEVHDKATSADVDFAALVAEYSDDPQASSNQGRYTDTPLDRFVEPFAEAVTGLEPGEISQPVKTDYGYHIIRLDGREPARQKSYQEVKDELAARMKKDHFEAIRKRFLDGLIEQTNITADPHTIELLRQAYGDPATP